MRKWALLLSILLFGLPTLANDIYVGPSAAGAANGADCADARSYTWVNSAANWGTLATQIGPGTTVHLCSGTYTAPAGGNILIAQRSGTSSAPITFKFESGAVMQAPYFSPSSGAISLNNQSYLVVDGGSNGTIENMSNGSPGASCLSGPCSYQQPSTGMYAAACNGCEIKNLTIANIYVHTQCDASSGCDTTLSDFSAAKAVTYSGQSFSVHDCVIHDAGAAFYNYGQGPADSTEFYNNEIYNIDHGWFGGAPSGTTNFTISIHDNHIHDQANWDTGAANDYHHDGIHIYSGGSNAVDTLLVYNNLFDGNEGQCCITSWIYIQSTVKNAFIYNNVFVQTISVPNGAVSFGNDTVAVGPGNYKFYNNTFLSTAGAGNTAPAIFCSGTNTAAGLSVTVQNNAFSGYNSYISLGAAVASLTAANNVYANNSGGGNSYWRWNSAAARTLSSWQSACGCDAGAVANLSGSLGVSATGAPQSGSMVLGAGLNLLSLATNTLNPLSYDTSAGDTRTPAARPTLGSWDAGAYEYSGLLSSAPAAPTNLSAVVQ